MNDDDSTIANSYRFLEGYTADPSGGQLFAMLKAANTSNTAERENEARLVKISSSEMEISTTKTYLAHANDCTYYDGNYYVVTSKTNDKKIYSFDEYTLSKTHTFEY